MTATSIGTARAGPTTRADLVAMLAAALIGLSAIWLAGLSQAAALHDAAHDTRHAAGFPCH